MGAGIRGRATELEKPPFAIRFSFLASEDGLNHSRVNPADMKLFAVVRSRGGAWRNSVALELQPDWDAHAAFMDRLHAEKFVVLGGPLEGTEEVLLIVRANGPDEIVQRFAGDPWSEAGLLRISRIAPWTVRLGTLS